jgi:hypothetical protein
LICTVRSIYKNFSLLIHFLSAENRTKIEAYSSKMMSPDFLTPINSSDTEIFRSSTDKIEKSTGRLSIKTRNVLSFSCCYANQDIRTTKDFCPNTIVRGCVLVLVGFSL